MKAKSRINKKRSRDGRYSKGMSWKERLSLLTLLLCSMGWGYYNHTNYVISANTSDPVIEVRGPETASDPIQIQESSVPERIEEITQKEEIINYITEVFGEDAEEAILIAKCESKLIPDRIGDEHLMSFNGEEWIGDSIGIFQVRTGGAGWNRARANGMSVAEFRANLKDYKYNVDYAKTIFDRSGWDAWYNCMRNVL